MNNEKPTSAEGLSTSEGVWSEQTRLDLRLSEVKGVAYSYPHEPLAHESIVLTSVNQRDVIVRYTELHIHK